MKRVSVAAAALALVFSAVSVSPLYAARHSAANSADAVLYQATWADGSLDGWQTAFVGPWTASSGNLYHPLGQNYDSSSIYAPFQLPIDQPLAVQATVRAYEATPTSRKGSFGIIATGVRAGYADFSQSTDRSVFVPKAEITDGTTDNTADFDPGTDWHTYRLEIDGTTYRLLIDGRLVQQLVTTQGASVTSVGLYAWGADIRVSDFEVLSLNNSPDSTGTAGPDATATAAPAPVVNAPSPTSTAGAPASTLPTLKPLVPKTTKVLGASALTHLRTTPASVIHSAASGSHLTLTFVRPNAKLKSLKRGSVITAGVTRNTPDGLLRRVLSVTRKGTREIVKTASASLPEAIKDGTLSVRGTLGTGGYRERAVWRGGKRVTLVRPRFQTQYCASPGVGMSHTFDIGGGDNDTIDTCFTVTWSLDYTVYLFQPSSFTFTTSATLTAHDSATAYAVHVSKDGTYPLDLPLPDVTVLIGPVPVVIKPVLSLTGSFDFQAGSTLTLGVGQQTSLSSTITWNSSSGWNETHTHNTTFSVDSPNLNVTAAATVSTAGGPRLDLLLYGAAGPYVDIQGTAEFHADPTGSSCFSADLGVQADVGVAVDVPHVLSIDHSFPVVNQTIAHWDSGGPCFGAPATVPPAVTPIPAPKGYPSPDAAIQAAMPTINQQVVGSYTYTGPCTSGPSGIVLQSNEMCRRSEVTGDTAPPIHVYELYECCPVVPAITIPTAYVYLGQYSDGSWIYLSLAPCQWLAEDPNPLDACLQRNTPSFSP